MRKWNPSKWRDFATAIHTDGRNLEWRRWSPEWVEMPLQLETTGAGREAGNLRQLCLFAATRYYNGD
jgi:hypothetical protein